MQIKTLLTALVGLAVLSDAAEIGRRSPFARTIERRQFRNGFGGGNRNGNGGNNNNNNNNGGNRNNGNGNGNGNNNNNNNNNGGGGNTALSRNVIQRGSQQDGNNPGADNQAASATLVSGTSTYKNSSLTKRPVTMPTLSTSAKARLLQTASRFVLDPATVSVSNT